MLLPFPGNQPHLAMLGSSFSPCRIQAIHGKSAYSWSLTVFVHRRRDRVGRKSLTARGWLVKMSYCNCKVSVIEHMTEVPLLTHNVGHVLC
jgi:hypothetical protein